METPASLPAPTKKALQWEVLLVGALVVLVGAYAFLSLQSVNAQLAGLQNQSVNLSTRLGALEGTQAIREAVTLTLLYDASCTACDSNASLQAFADDFNRQLAEQGTRLQLEDVSARLPELFSLGVKSLPSLYLSDAAVARSDRAARLVANPGWERIPGGYVLDALGLGFGDKGVAVKELLAVKACTSPFTAKLKEFSAYSCPQEDGTDYCRSLYPAVRVVRANHVSKLDYAFRHFVLSEDGTAFLAAQAGECARDQGAFNEFTGRARESASLDNSVLKGIAREIGLNETQFNECVQSQEKAAKVRSDTSEARDVYGLASGPAYVMDCRYVFGAVDAESLEARVCATRPDLCVKANANATTSGNATGNETNASATATSGTNASTQNQSA